MDNYNNYNDNSNSLAKIAIIGVGGGGVNAIEYMVNHKIEDVKYLGINTDYQSLSKLSAMNIPILKLEKSRGLGAGGNPEVGREATEEVVNEIKKFVEGQDMVFVTAGMGGGTGTGGSPVVARVAKELGILTVGIVTKPFIFEGQQRVTNADYGIAELKNNVDTLITIPNQKVFDIYPSASVQEAFTGPNSVLYTSVRAIVEIINKQGFINRDFADIKSIMKDSGECVIGFGTVPSEEDPINALNLAVSHPLIERKIDHAKNLLVSVTINPKDDVSKFIKIQNHLTTLLNPENTEYTTNIMFGLIFEEDINTVNVTILATGFNGSEIVEKKTIQSQPTNTSRVTLPVLDD